MSITIERCFLCGNTEQDVGGMADRLRSSEALAERLSESLRYQDNIWITALHAVGISQEQMLEISKFSMAHASGAFEEKDKFEDMVKFFVKGATEHIEKMLTEPGRIVETGERRLLEWHKQQIEKSGD